MDLTLHQDIADAIAAVMRKHGHFYDKSAWVSPSGGGVSTSNSGGCTVEFTVAVNVVLDDNKAFFKDFNSEMKKASDET